MEKKAFIWLMAASLFIITLLTLIDHFYIREVTVKTLSSAPPLSGVVWRAPDTGLIPYTPEGEMIRYGRELIAHTANYLGPKGTVSHLTNGMNCDNCHIDAGTRNWGNNFSLVASTYPKYRDRSGRMESVEWRVNECLERSLNGKRLDSTDREMRAMVAYLKWVGKDVPRKSSFKGAGTEELPYLDRPADTGKGKTVFMAKCQTCHGKNGEGKPDSSGIAYQYPPLWGPDSYNTGAGIYRLSKFAGYIKNNMPLGTTYGNAQLSDEEAWDVAAFVNSQPRPAGDLRMDWPKLSTKPMDYPFGPYTDSFSEIRHKFGPFMAIRLAHERNKEMKK